MFAWIIQLTGPSRATVAQNPLKSVLSLMRLRKDVVDDSQEGTPDDDKGDTCLRDLINSMGDVMRV
jgi:hypothetical protein